MSTRIKLAALAISLAAALTMNPSAAQAAVSFSAGLEISSPAEFDSPLAPYGVWETVAPYGRCWHPADVPPGWCPYGNGYWEWTDCGWYWVSEEPWAWACYHYGSWVFEAPYGWVWIPGVEWAPAWVVWRESPDYIGWAPCGPAGFTVAPAEFVFVDVHHFHDRIRPGAFVVNDRRIIDRTRLVNDIQRTSRTFDGVSRRVVVNRGPDPSLIQRATGTRFTARPIQDVVSRTPAPASVPRTKSGPVFERPVQPMPRSTTARGEATPAQRAPELSPRREPESRPPSSTGREVPRTYAPPPASRAVPPSNLQSPPAPAPRPVPQVPPSSPEVRRVYPQPPPVPGPDRNPNQFRPAPREQRVNPGPPQRPPVPPGRERHDEGDRGP